MLYNEQPADVVNCLGPSSSHCGYCDSDDGFHTFGMWAYSLSPQTYKNMLDLGWRRSGEYLYRPDLEKGCCKLYTIKLDPFAFKPAKSHRKVLNKFNRWVLGENWETRLKDAQTSALDQARAEKQNTDVGGSVGTTSSETFVSKDSVLDSHKAQSTHAPNSTASDLAKGLSAPLIDILPLQFSPSHNFEIVTERSSFSEEKYQLYRAYQSSTHHQSDSEISESGFKRFLCTSPIHPTLAATSTALPQLEYGSIHQRYIIDGRLVALAVLDVLPECLSSVYFAYHPDFQHLSLGKLSALYECQYAKFIMSMPDDLVNTPSPNFDVAESAKTCQGGYYMGYYIPNCQKMKYKGEYFPSMLLDPDCNRLGNRAWHPLEKYQSVWKDRASQQVEVGATLNYYVSFENPSDNSSSTINQFSIVSSATNESSSGSRSSEPDSDSPESGALSNTFPGLSSLSEPARLMDLLASQLVLHAGVLTAAILCPQWQRKKKIYESKLKDLIRATSPELVERMIIVIA